MLQSTGKLKVIGKQLHNSWLTLIIPSIPVRLWLIVTTQVMNDKL